MRGFITLVFAATVSFALLACAHAGPPDTSFPQAVAVDAVNLNTATEKELIDLPGVGPAKAAAILEYRKKHGEFKRIEDLNKVKGFGRKTVARLRPSLTVERADGAQPR